MIHSNFSTAKVFLAVKSSASNTCYVKAEMDDIEIVIKMEGKPPHLAPGVVMDQ